jgi:hypothetical protein
LNKRSLLFLLIPIHIIAANWTNVNIFIQFLFTGSTVMFWQLTSHQQTVNLTTKPCSL